MSLLTLARWLGPWASEEARPAIDPEPLEVAGRFPAWRYAPADPRGTYLIAPGLHYAGPEDPRMDRFCRILAAAGFEVICPFLPDYTALQVRPSAIEDFLTFVDQFEDRSPALFSISFGSLLALRAAAARDFVRGVVLFGGFADFRDVVRFALSGAEARPHDPLNRPVVVLNCLAHLEHQAGDTVAVTAAWDRYVRRTWGRPEMKLEGAWQRAAREEAGELTGPELALYELGTGLREGALAACLEAIDRAGAGFAHLDARPHLESLRCPVRVLHGADDDVIPFEQAEIIARALPAHVDQQVHVTGIYGHTGGSGLSPGSAIRELRTMLRMLRSISLTARR